MSRSEPYVRVPKPLQPLFSNPEKTKDLLESYWAENAGHIPEYQRKFIPLNGNFWGLTTPKLSLVMGINCGSLYPVNRDYPVQLLEIEDEMTPRLRVLYQSPQHISYAERTRKITFLGPNQVLFYYVTSSCPISLSFCKAHGWRGYWARKRLYGVLNENS